MLDACEALLTIMYVLAAATVLFSIHVRCKASFEDVERHCLRQGNTRLYTFRAASLVVLVGGAMHARRLIGLLASNAFKRMS